MNQELWDNYFTSNKIHPHYLNGHFAAVRWNEHGVDFYTDSFGLKHIFFHSTGSSVLFSTRLDALLPLTDGCSISWNGFESRWVGTHGYGTGSFINGIERLSRGGTARIEGTDDSLSISHKRWSPTEQESNPGQIIELLSSFSTLPMKAGKRVSLGLSGGFDSRVLLANLSNQPNSNWQTHTFGTADQPDRILADRLADITQNPHYPLPEPDWPADKILEHLSSFVGQTLFTSLPSTMIRLSPYEQLRKMNAFVIDGAFGEIARRRLAQRIYLRKSNALKKEQFKKLVPLFKFQRADIFSPDINETLNQGFQEELLSEFEQMPSLHKTGTENWLDLFSIRTQAPNAGGPEQSRSDALLPNYMAYLQPQFVDAVLSLPLKHRKNGSMLRKYLRQHNPELCKVPLVKGVRSYPFWMKDKSAVIWTRLKYLLADQYRDTAEIDMLKKIETYVRDTAASKDVQTYSPYDQKKIETLIQRTYDQNDFDAAHRLNWWLTFETFRQLLHR